MGKKKFAPAGILYGLLLLVALCGLAVTLLLSVDLLYRLDIKLLDIPAYSGYSEEVILRNYHAATAYLNPFVDRPFTLPDLAVSESGSVHFADVKNITDMLFLLAAVCIVLLVIWTIRHPPGAAVRRSAGLTILLLPLLVGAAMLVDPQGFFVLFHKIFFSNDYWIFHWDRDQIIRILPTAFFLHCAAVIVLFWLAAGVTLLLRSRARRTPHKEAGEQRDT